MHQIMRITKYLFNNVRYWIDSYSLELIRRASEMAFTHDQPGFANTCRLCHGHVDEMMIKDAKDQLLGPSNWRELFEEELREDQWEK